MLASSPGGDPCEVLVGVVLCGPQGLEHVAELSVVPHVDVIANDGQAPAHQATGTAKRMEQVRDKPGSYVGQVGTLWKARSAP